MSTGLELYDRAAQSAAGTVITAYSTSFSLAARLLGARVRPHVRNVYALVRIADEVVDGPAAEAGLAPETLRRVLDELEAETLTAITRGFSTNLIVHAFCRTAREAGIDSSLVRPFFASMRTDLSVAAHDARSHDSYVYGSAEVVGLMCLQIFLNIGASSPVTPSAELRDGARRLGAAFQDVNFLRDLSHDATALGRDYLGVRAGGAARTEVLDRVDADLAAAAAVVPQLPSDCRRAVTVAHDLFAALAQRLRADDGIGQDLRVRVPDPVKATLAARAMLGFGPRGART
ncbi:MULTISPECIES: squalene/phytoene synthase family protein [unclassified Microbacterium]|uniref:phytoene/squalene synthase family protein n=1 Tax=unclassified Microbacterium TaxID=2609290 RepID=UPI00214B53C4|nr:MULTISPECIES: squalene/phytoene synthase family protein [unclassified Microbacterium]MCR2784488.1 squalene/phytoene synthase family protein [Microbacterium sp. zg.B96]WIM14700.1 squalene/phytoene synthase family protein [Microbacterium sp. zg-B96]